MALHDEGLLGLVLRLSKSHWLVVRLNGEVFL